MNDRINTNDVIPATNEPDEVDGQHLRDGGMTVEEIATIRMAQRNGRVPENGAESAGRAITIPPLYQECPAYKSPPSKSQIEDLRRKIDCQKSGDFGTSVTDSAKAAARTIAGLAAGLIGGAASKHAPDEYDPKLHRPSVPAADEYDPKLHRPSSKTETPKPLDSDVYMPKNDVLLGPDIDRPFGRKVTTFKSGGTMIEAGDRITLKFKDDIAPPVDITLDKAGKIVRVTQDGNPVFYLHKEEDGAIGYAYSQNGAPLFIDKNAGLYLDKKTGSLHYSATSPKGFFHHKVTIRLDKATPEISNLESGRLG